MILDKHIFLLRHGETILNAEHIRQGSDGGLSVTGKEQALKAANRLKYFNIKKILVSPFERTIETANIVSSVINKNYEICDLLAERRNPKEIIGRKYEDPLTVQVINYIDKSFHAPEARYSDEENFNDLKDRAIKLRSFLEINTVNKTLCISHGIFLKMFVSLILIGDGLTVSDYIKLSVYNPADNAAISLISYSPVKKFFGKNPWTILAYNDTSL